MKNRTGTGRRRHARHLYGRRAGCISGAGHQSGWRDRVSAGAVHGCSYVSGQHGRSIRLLFEI